MYEITTPISRNPLYASFASSGNVGGVAFADEDILKFDGTTWSLFFDGPDVGVESVNVFAFSLLDADTILISFNNSVTVGGLTFARTDIARFDAASLGPTTAGTFSMYFNGVDVGLDTSSDYIDAIEVLPNNNVLISAGGNPSVPGLTGLAASDPFVLDQIRNAEALFIAGGDQANYVEDWKDTPVEEAINLLAARGVPVGGTSAGLAVMGQFVFSAINGTVYSDTALANPYNNKVALDTDFLSLPYMKGVITDSHFSARNRMGRLVTFLARITNDKWADQALGVGINERIALTMEPDGTARVLGESSVYFLKTPGAPQVCQPKTALTYHDIQVYRISVDDKNASFNFSRWTGKGCTQYTLSVNEGVITSTQPGGGIY